MASIKKSVRLSEETASILHKLTISGETNWSGSINAMAEQYKIFAEENLPTLSDKQKLAFYCAYNGYMPHPNISEEIKMLSWNISEGYQYDEQIRDALGSSDNASEFINIVNGWSDSQKLAVIFMARSFWRSGQSSIND